MNIKEKLSITLFAVSLLAIMGKGLGAFESISWWWITLPWWLAPAVLLFVFFLYLLWALFKGILRLFGKEVRNVRKY